MKYMTGLIAATASLALPLTLMAAPELYQIEPGHTYPSFETSHQGLSSWRGKFNRTTGKIWLDAVGKTGRMEIEVDTRSINFGLPLMDRVAQGEEWFDTAKYPTATYRGTISYAGDKPAVVNGELTLRGITKPLQLKVISFNCRMNPMFKREHCGGEATATFDRRDFGLVKEVVPTDPNVRLTIDVEALKGDQPLPVPPPGMGKDGPPPSLLPQS